MQLNCLFNNEDTNKNIRPIHRYGHHVNTDHRPETSEVFHFHEKREKTLCFVGETWQPGFNTTLNQTNVPSGITEGDCNVFDSIIRRLHQLPKQGF